MHHQTLLVALAALIAQATATTIQVGVGQNGLSFTPSSVTAAMGDIIEYHFFPPNHSVVMGDFNNPCAPVKTGGFFSGFFSSSEGGNSNVFQVTINSTDPIFVYCGFPTHCESGMSGVINPSADQTLAKYQSAAGSVSNTVVPSAAFGGKVVAAGSSSGGSTTTSSSPSSTPTSGGGGIYGSPSGSGAASWGVSLVGALGAALLMI